MRRLFVVVLSLGVVLAVVAVVGPSLPVGNPVRTLGEGLREIGGYISRAFGGGYGELAP